MIIDAIVLAGGRASRLGGASKAALRHDGRTLLEAVIAACSVARRIAVVGDEQQIADAAPGAHILVTREEPPFSGPASAIAAGLDRLSMEDAPSADFTLVLACDMPRVAEVVSALTAALRAESGGVVLISSDGTAQQLSALYATVGLVESIAAHRNAGDLDGLSVRALVSPLNPARVTAEPGSTDDVDTWSDAERLGVIATSQSAS